MLAEVADFIRHHISSNIYYSIFHKDLYHICTETVCISPPSNIPHTKLTNYNVNQSRPATAKENMWTIALPPKTMIVPAPLSEEDATTSYSA
mmetsp:Transcript_5761/g.10361  ORF Transcript_5761/g.10361 Transcript_5761/m.10361 type:complete len:92 (+) Transcript_5761:217-492(+)